MCGKCPTLPVSPTGRTGYLLSRCDRTYGHFLPYTVSVSPNPLFIKLIGSKEGIAPPSARRSVASSITSTTLQRQSVIDWQSITATRTSVIWVGGPITISVCGREPFHGSPGDFIAEIKTIKVFLKSIIYKCYRPDRSVTFGPPFEM